MSEGTFNTPVMLVGHPESVEVELEVVLTLVDLLGEELLVSSVPVAPEEVVRLELPAEAADDEA